MKAIQCLCAVREAKRGTRFRLHCSSPHTRTSARAAVSKHCAPRAGGGPGRKADSADAAGARRESPGELSTRKQGDPRALRGWSKDSTQRGPHRPETELPPGAPPASRATRIKPAATVAAVLQGQSGRSQGEATRNLHLRKTFDSSAFCTGRPQRPPGPLTETLTLRRPPAPFPRTQVRPGPAPPPRAAPRSHWRRLPGYAPERYWIDHPRPLRCVFFPVDGASARQ